MLLTLIGDEAAAGYDTVRGQARVDVDTGANYFEKTADGTHAFVVKAREDAYYKNEIDRQIG